MNELEKAAKKHKKINRRKNQLGWFQTFVGDAEIEANFFNHCNASESPSVNPTGPMGEGYDADSNHIIRKYMRDWTFDEAQQDYYNSTLGMYLREYERMHEVDEDDYFNESVNGSVQDFYNKMVGKSKPEVEKIVLAARGNPNADEAYRKWLQNNGLNEELDETVELVYDQLEIEVNVGSPSGYYDVGYGNWLPDDRYETRYVDVTLEKDADDIIEYLVDWALADGIITAEEDEEIYKYAEEHFDELVEKYYDKLLDKYEDDAIEAAYDKVDLYEGKFDLREALNNVDLRTNNKYDLRNMYDASSLTEEKKMKLAHMLRENVSPAKLYEYFSFDDDVDDQDYRIGLTLFAEGREYKVLNVLDTKEVDGYELAIVYALPEDTNNPDEAYFVLLNNDIEWGPCDTAEECSEWWEDVTDGYYDGDDDYDPDDDYGEW